MLGHRSPGRVARAILSPRHYVAFANSFRVYRRPVENLRRYVLGGGEYPYTCGLRTPIGTVPVTAHHPDDMRTVNEVFCRHDYAASADVRVVLDLGSNIGVSGLYFLTRNAVARCYLFEPDPRNLAKLRTNLAGYEERYVLSECAVSDADGYVDFGIEPTGRYGTIGTYHSETIRVLGRDINGVLEDVLEREARIDILKLDVEGTETRILRAIRAELLDRIALIYAEVPRGALELPGFSQSRRGSVVRFARRDD